jgi:predicted porin
MKKMISLAAMFAALSYASPAFADTNITVGGTNINVYGTLDTAFGDVSHSLSIDPQFPASVNPVSPVKRSVVHGAAIGLFNGGISDSRLGVKGTTDIGDGLKVFYTLEEGFNLPTGRVNNAAAELATNGETLTTAGANSSMNGQLFNRQAFVGLSYSDWGSLAVGRNYAPIYDICVTYDPVQDAQLFSPLGFSGTYGGGGGVSEDTRVDNSLKYTNKIGSFNFGGLLKLGGTLGEATAKTAYALNAGYEEGNFGIQGTYQAFNDAITGVASAATSNAVDITNENTKAWMVAAKYKIGAATLKIGYQQYTLGAPSNIISTTTTLYNYYGQNVGKVSNFSATASDKSTHILFGGGDYNFSSKFNMAAGVYSVSPQANTDLSQSYSNQMYYSLLADYHITKSLDTYAGLMYATFSGVGLSSSTYYQNNTITAVGVRYKF